MAVPQLQLTVAHVDRGPVQGLGVFRYFALSLVDVHEAIVRPSRRESERLGERVRSAAQLDELTERFPGTVAVERRRVRQERQRFFARHRVRSRGR